MKKENQTIHLKKKVREGLIHVKSLRPTGDGNAVEVIGALKSGELAPGMFLQIPMNGMLNFTFKIVHASPLEDGSVCIELDCKKDPIFMNLMMGLNFEDETLMVVETGQN